MKLLYLILGILSFFFIIVICDKFFVINSDYYPKEIYLSGYWDTNDGLRSCSYVYYQHKLFRWINYTKIEGRNPYGHPKYEEFIKLKEEIRNK